MFTRDSLYRAKPKDTQDALAASMKAKLSATGYTWRVVHPRKMWGRDVPCVELLGKDGSDFRCKNGDPVYLVFDAWECRRDTGFVQYTQVYIMHNDDLLDHEEMYPCDSIGTDKDWRDEFLEMIQEYVNLIV